MTKTLPIAFILTVFLALTAAGASGPQPGDVDPSFNMGSGINGFVTMTILQTNGQVIIGGIFTTVNGAVRPGLARLNADGSTDFGFMNSFSGITPRAGQMGINSIALQSDGKLIIAGNFAGVNGISRTNVARLNPDGTLDTSFGNGMAGPDAEINAIAIQPDGKVLIGGAFGTVNGVSILSVARLNSDGSLDAGFHSPLSCCSVLTLGLQSDGKILIGGNFSPHVARLKANGDFDTTFLITGVFPYGSYKIAPDGKIYIGGTIDGVNGIYRLYGNGSLDTTFNSTNVSGVLGAVQPDGKLITAVNCARYNLDGSKDASFAVALAADASGVDHVLVLPDGKIILSGLTMAFTNGVVRYGIARVNSNGSLDTGFENYPGGATQVFPTSPNWYVNLLTVQPDGKVLVSGDFDFFDGMARQGFARLKSDGSLDSGFQNKMAGVKRYGNVNDTELQSGRVGVALVQADGHILIGGGFESVNGNSRTNLARLNPDGSLDSNFVAQVIGPPDYSGNIAGTVAAIAAQTNGQILIGGFFNLVDGVTRYGVARLKADGTLDPTFQNGMQGAYGITAIAVQPDGKILIAGDFGYVNGESRANIARLNEDGSLDSGFLPVLLDSPYGPASISLLMVLQPDGKIVVGGSIQAVNGISRTNLVRLNSDGSLDNGFISGVPSTHQTTALALQPDGKILVGNYARTNLSRLNSDGSLDTSFQCGLQVVAPWTGFGVYVTVKNIILQSNGRMFIQGLFDTVNGGLRPKIVEIFASIPQPRITGVGLPANQFGFNLTGYSNQLAVIEGSTNLLNWMPLQTNTLGLDPVSFSDPNQTNFPKRFYRVRLQ